MSSSASSSSSNNDGGDPYLTPSITVIIEQSLPAHWSRWRWSECWQETAGHYWSEQLKFHYLIKFRENQFDGCKNVTFWLLLMSWWCHDDVDNKPKIKTLFRFIKDQIWCQTVVSSCFACFFHEVCIIVFPSFNPNQI